MNAAAKVDRLQAFRNDVYHCFDHRADALFNLFDAITVAGLIPSFAHLSLQGPFERGHGSLYAALTKGTLDIERVRALVGTTLNRDHPLVFAIDTSTWVRNDAETSPQRGYFYHPSRHSAGKPVVAGWSYSWVAQLGPVSSSWTAPLDVRRVAPDRTAHELADEQVQHIVRLLPPGTAAPLFVFDGGYDPTRLAKLKDADCVSVLVRVRRNRRFFFDVTTRPGPQGGRPRIHGAKFLCADQTTWPSPHLEHLETTEQYGAVHVRAWTGLHVKSSQDTRPGSRHFKPTYTGTVVLLEVAKLPRETRQPQAFWLWWRGPGVPDLGVLWRAYTRRFDLEHTFRFCKQTLNWETPRVRHPEQADRWTLLVLLAFTQLRLAQPVVTDHRLPWQRPQECGRLTPSRVRQGFVQLLVPLGSPACAPKPSGRSPGRPKGKCSGRAPRFPALKKSA